MKEIYALIGTLAMSQWKAASIVLTVVGTIGFWQLESSLSAEGLAVHDDINRAELSLTRFADVIATVKPAVVNISTSNWIANLNQGAAPGRKFLPGWPFEEFFHQFMQPQSADKRQGWFSLGAGSGFLIEPDGYVVTNHHVIEHADSIIVTLENGRKYDAKLLGSDQKTDLALLKVEAEQALPYVSFGSSDETRVGNWVIAIGNPFGLGGTATTGIVSARGRDIHAGPFDDFLQIDAPINQGNSGGPLFNMDGEIVGINTAIYSPNGGSVGIGFAIPSAQAEPIIHALRTKGHVERGWLGIEIQPIDEDIAESLGLNVAEGALVSRVLSNSPAALAGFITSDVILSMNSKLVKTVKDVSRTVAATRPGNTLTVIIWRDRKRQSLTVNIIESEETGTTLTKITESEMIQRKLGITLSELIPETRQQYQVRDNIQGVLVTSVSRESPAALKGLRPGDVITMVGQKQVHSLKEAERAIKNPEFRRNVLLLVTRGERQNFVSLSLN